MVLFLGLPRVSLGNIVKKFLSKVGEGGLENIYEGEDDNIGGLYIERGVKTFYTI